MPGSSNTQSKILNSAIDLFYAQGYHATTMREIAKGAGIQTASLYYFFKDKNEILFTIMNSVLVGMTEAITSALAGLDHPSERIATAMRTHVKFHATRYKEAMIADSEIRALDPHHREIIINHRDAYEQIWRDILTQGQHEGLFRVDSVKFWSFALLAMGTNVATWYRPDGELPLTEIAEHFARIALQSVGVGTPEAVTERKNSSK